MIQGVYPDPHDARFTRIGVLDKGEGWHMMEDGLMVPIPHEAEQYVVVEGVIGTTLTGYIRLQTKP